MGPNPEVLVLGWTEPSGSAVYMKQVAVLPQEDTWEGTVI